jgi:hypothetical protein
MSTHYPDVFKKLLDTCRGYRAKFVDLAVMKATIWSAAQSVVAADEKQHRDALQKAEGELDMIQFTVDQTKVFDETLPVVNAIEAMARDALGATESDD